MILLVARKHYTNEFRRQAVELYESTEGATLRGIAGDLGIARGTLAEWVGALGTGTTTATTSSSTTPSDRSSPSRTESQAAELPGSRPGCGSWKPRRSSSPPTGRS